jgi:5,10-methylenetetrahydrofolate reductase
MRKIEKFEQFKGINKLLELIRNFNKLSDTESSIRKISISVYYQQSKNAIKGTI